MSSSSSSTAIPPVYSVPVADTRLVPGKPLLPARQAPPPRHVVTPGEAAQLTAWLLILTQNIVLFIASLLSRATSWPIIAAFALNFFQPYCFLISVYYQRRTAHIFVSTAFFIVNLLVALDAFEQPAWLQKWRFLSAVCVAGFSLFSVLYQFSQICVQPSNRVSSVICAIGVLVSTLGFGVEQFTYDAIFLTAEGVSVAVAAFTLLMLATPLCFCARSNSLRFIMKSMVATGVIASLTLDMKDARLAHLESAPVVLARVLSVSSIGLVIAALWEIEETLKDEGERLYNDRLPHDQYSL